jgi:hypothetical protein
MRVRLAAALIATLVIAAVGTLCLLTGGRGPCRERFELVAYGMTRDEVITAIGGPPGDYRSDPQRFSVSHHSLMFFGCEEWISNDGFLKVTYDSAGRVNRAEVLNVIDTQAGWWQRLVWDR